MTEPRDRPQYGEYASVDEQIAAGGFAVEPLPVRQPAPATPAQLAPPIADTRVVGDPPVARPWDLALTTALLVFGAYAVVSSIPDFLDYATALTRVYATVGAGEYTSVDLANAIGIALLVSQVVLYLATAALTFLRLRAHKISFFVPLAGAVAYGVVTTVLVGIALFSDPAYALWLDSLS